MCFTWGAGAADMARVRRGERVLSSWFLPSWFLPSWFLPGILSLKHGVPIDDAFRRPFRACGPGSVSRSMESGVGHEFSAQVQGAGLSMAPVLGRSCDRARGRSALHTVSAWGSERRPVLVEAAADARSNQTTAAPKCSPPEVLHPSAAGAAWLARRSTRA